MNKSFPISLFMAVFAISLISTNAGAQGISPSSPKLDYKPIQLSLFTPIQLVPEGDHIKGFRFNLVYGRNASVTGLDMGLVNHNTSGLSMGVQFGFVSLNEDDFMGWQNNVVNITRGNFEGFQSGFINYAQNVNGIQFGLVNYAGTMTGLQIGLINIIKQGGAFPVFPIVNWSF